VKNPDTTKPSEGQPNLSQRILVVDDEVDLRKAMIQMLSLLGSKNVDAAYDGADAWEALHKTTYGLVITDHNMPRVTGLELITRMRAEGMAQPVILISGLVPTDELERHPGLRVDAVMQKPFMATELAATVKSLLSATGSPISANDNQPSPTGEPATAPRRGQKNVSTRILVVDDNHDSRQLQIDLLTSSGYEVESASDGAAGWEALRDHDYDLVITDNHMPKMTGVGMIENLHLSGMTIPVIMVTGQLPTEEFAQKPWLKPEAMLQKPVADRDLLETISHVLGTDGGEGEKTPPAKSL
jgi:CheY-like chemotaxis protein